MNTPALNQNLSLHLSGEDCPPLKATNIPDLASAVTICQRYIKEHGLLNSTFGGAKLLINNTQFAYISYNGRVWEGNARNRGKEINV